MSHVKGLRCRECGAESPIAPLHVCETCFGPLEVAYDPDVRIGRDLLAVSDTSMQFRAFVGTSIVCRFQSAQVIELPLL